MHGMGFIKYDTSAMKEKDASYEGEFYLNSREGSGILTKKNGDIYKGNFKNNCPNGETEIFFENGDHYVGEVIKGVMTG